MHRLIFLLCLLCGSLLLSGQNDNFEIEILKQSHLLYLPSASGVEIVNNNLYVVGDDSPYLFQLNQDFKIVQKTLLTGNDSTVGNRIPKYLKSDYESIAKYSDQDENQFMAVLSSGSKLTTRDTLKIFSLSKKSLVISKNVRPLFELIREKANFSQEDEINIEAFAIGKNSVYLMQRGNNNYNILIEINRNEFLDYAFGDSNSPPNLDVTSFILPSLDNTIAGFSGACLLPDESGLLFVSSLEASSNAYDDGEILGSYVGILQFGKQNNNLRTSILRQNSEIVKTKLEGIAIRSFQDNIFQLVAVSDNDDGTSMIFNLEMKLTSPDKSFKH